MKVKLQFLPPDGDGREIGLGVQICKRDSPSRAAQLAVLKRQFPKGRASRVEIHVRSVDEHAEESNAASDTITHSIDINATCNIYIHKILHTQVLA